MAKLIKCAGCGEEISKNAKSCPHCGEPKAKPTSLLTWLVLILFIIGIFGSMSSNDNSSSSIAKTTAAVKKIIPPKKLTKAEIEKTKKEILKQLKKIPSSKYEKNKNLYQKLLNYEPNNKKYKEKVEFYSNKLKIATQKEKIKLAIFGEKPTQSSWDGSYYAVETYLKRVARDPDSVKISNCTQVYEGKEGWLVGCEWRGKNGFRGMNATVNWFTIRQNKVILMEKASAYKLN